MRRFLAILTLLVALPASASALDLYGVDLRVGIRGGPNVPIATEPSDIDAYPATPYGNFIGFGWNIGWALNVRAFDIAAFVFGVMYSNEKADAIFQLDDVTDCSRGPRCHKQEMAGELSWSAIHLPMVVQVSLPVGVARPFLSFGIDIVLDRSNPRYEPVARDRLPESLDPVEDGELLSQWGQSAVANYALNADVNPDTPNTYAGIIAGVGLDIALDQIEIPVEFRLHIYPSAGQSVPERGNFPSRGSNTYDPSFTAQYNDMWQMQLFVLFGLDYVIF